jgi:UDP-N-acetylmuramoyl-L-alanyl-D-glutamate--2,6-diaminopimelate ligase
MIKWCCNVTKYSGKKRSYALKSYADYKAQILENQLSGLLLKIEGNEVWVN